MSEAPDSHVTYGERRPMSFLAAAAWTIGLRLLVDVLLQLTEGARPGALTDLVNVTVCQILAFSLVLFAMVRVYAPASPMRSALGFRAVSPLHLLVSVVVGVAILPAISTLEGVMLLKEPLSDGETEAVRRLFALGTPAARAFAFAAFGVAIPIAEELFFRGILFGGLRKGRTLGLAMLATAVYATSASFDPRMLLTGFVFALVVAWLRGQSGSVVSAIAAHVAFASADMARLLRGADPAAPALYPRSWCVGGLALALVALVAGRFLASRDLRAAAAFHDDE